MGNTGPQSAFAPTVTGREHGDPTPLLSNSPVTTLFKRRRTSMDASTTLISNERSPAWSPYEPRTISPIATNYSPRLWRQTAWLSQ